MIIGILPFLALFALIVVLSSSRWHAFDPVLDAFVIWGVFIFLLSEILSIWGLIRQPILLAVWGLLVVGLVAAIVCFGAHRDFARRVKELYQENRTAVPVLAIVGIICLITLFIALTTPPNYFDALDYHMARVANWAQNGRIWDYATYTARQLFMPPFTSMAILHSYVLAGGDWFANVVQWLAMFGALYAILKIGRDVFQLSPLQNALAAVILATIPQGILQSANVQTDYMTALWVTIFVCYVLIRQTDRRYEFLRLGAALGLGVLTKQTGLLFAFPFVVYFTVRELRENWRQALTHGLLIAAVALAINAPHIVRNTLWYGNSLGSSNMEEDQLVGRFDVAVAASNLIRYSSLNLSSTDVLNARLTELIDWFHLTVLHIGSHDPLTTTPVGPDYFEVPAFQAYAGRTGNLTHFVLGTIALAVLLARPRRVKPIVWWYIALVVFGYILIVLPFRFSPGRSRYQLAAFVLFAPVIALAFRRYLRNRQAVYTAVAGILALLCTPWLLSCRLKPVVPVAALTSTPSILVSSRMDEYFTTKPAVQTPFTDVARLIFDESSCRQIGLVSVNQSSYEYLLWALFQSYHDSFTMTYSEPTPDPNLHCAVIYLRLATSRYQPISGFSEYYWSDKYIALLLADPVTVPSLDPLSGDRPEMAIAGPGGSLPCGLAKVTWGRFGFDVGRKFPTCLNAFPDLSVYCLNNDGQWSDDNVSDTAVSSPGKTIAFTVHQDGICGLIPVSH